jgi:hypothetical protein
VNSRMLHQVVDYYDTGLISYTQVVRRLVYAETTTLSPLATSPSGILWTALYSFLDFTVTYCNHEMLMQSTNKSTPFLSDEVLERVEKVLPPPLDGRQSLLTISQEWQKQQETQEQYKEQICGATQTGRSATCPSVYWAGHPSTASVSHLGQILRQDGWSVVEDGRLRATKSSATLQWRVPVVTTTSWYAQLFVTVEKTIRDPVRLQWTVTSNKNGNHTNGHYEVDYVSKTLGVTISVPVVLPYPITESLEFKLQLVKGDGVDVVAFGLFEGIL